MKAIDAMKVIEMLKNERERIDNEANSCLSLSNEFSEKETKAWNEFCELDDRYQEAIFNHQFDEAIALEDAKNDLWEKYNEYGEQSRNLYAEWRTFDALGETLFDAEMRLIANPVGVRFFLASLVATAQQLENKSRLAIPDFSTYLKVSCRIATVYNLFQTILDESRIFTKQDEEEILTEKCFHELHDLQ